MTENQWQPMAMAPKDGKPFLACGKDYLWPVAAYWDDKDHKFRLCEEDEAAHDLTHWIPLPELPPNQPSDQDRLVEAAIKVSTLLATMNLNAYAIGVKCRLTDALKPFIKELPRGS